MKRAICGLLVPAAFTLLVGASSNNEYRRSGKLESVNQEEIDILIQKRLLNDGGGSEWNSNNNYNGYNYNANNQNANGYNYNANSQNANSYNYNANGGDEDGEDDYATATPTEDGTYDDGSSTNRKSTKYYKNKVQDYYGNGAYGQNFFVDSQSTYYDGYQQAWRYLGHLVKCGYPSDRYDDNGSHSHSHSGDSGWSGNNYCQRYLVWAAYIDLDYEGGGIGEYSIYDPYTESWDYTGCNKHGNGRCAPMDCHLQNTTTWTLMGVYKEAEYFGNDAFFEQLFKHEGVCVWNDDDLYDFMSEARKSAWSQGCIATNNTVTDSYGTRNSIYIDLKPTINGNMSYGLYTDEVCKSEYRGSHVSVTDIAQKMGLLYGSYLDAWNNGLEIYKVCQPCMAYNLQNDYQSSSYSSYSSYSYNNNNKNYNNNNNNNNGNSASSSSGNSVYDVYGVYSNNNIWNSGGNANAADYSQQGSDGSNGWWNKWFSNGNNGNRRLNDNRDDPNEGYFQCDDDAGYTNVNQCMKFRSHAELEVASWEDLVIATEQMGILDIVVGGTVFGTEKMTYAQQQYMEKVRKAKEAEEEAEYKALVASVPSPAPMQTAGRLSAMIGPISLALVCCWVVYRQKKFIDENYEAKKAEPLVKHVKMEY